MAKVLQQYEPKRRGPKTRYPWDQWLDGKIRRLDQGKGKDFQCSVTSMVDLVRKTARKRGVSVTVHEESAACVIVPEEAPQAPRKPRKRNTGSKPKTASGRKRGRG